ncbi:MAG TPA: cell division protein ZipA C-terminal FtsZ-binding domain-containing protein [Usitatibacteraceae bacterium]|nr:cell division protein ZipA C-terminal FtsZ-binding domain-containing protein [Usitatibacteraceae bacterium]
MSDLQLALIALGAALVAAVAGYNALSERRARRRAETAFRSSHPDALLDPEEQRREPVLGVLPGDARQDPSLGALDEVIDPVGGGEPAQAAAASPSAVISGRVDAIALVLADEPVTREQLEPLLDALEAHATPVHVEGLVDEQWMPVEDSPRDRWRELRAGLQLASRAGPVAEEEIAAFNETVAGFAASINAVSQRESPAAAAARSRELDRFCAEADIEVAVNLVGRAGATFAIARVKSLALESGFAETASGSFERRGADGAAAMTLRLADSEPRRDSVYVTGLSFALDVPHVADPVAVLDEMGKVAEAFGLALGGEMVDDERRPLGAAGFAAIRRSLEAVARRMEAHGIPPGGALARRLFS